MLKLRSGLPAFGEVFTRRWVVDVLLDLTGYTADRDLGGLRLLEPSCGSGAFLGPIVERLIDSAGAHGRELTTLGDAIRAYDLQQSHVDGARLLCVEILMSNRVGKEDATRLAATWVRHADFLLDGVSDHRVDVAVGNPPYIRYDDLDATVADEYRRSWSTMRGRGDIYVGFLERALGMLRPGGRLGFICADRWMRNQYGAALRKLVAENYAVQHVWTMHDVDAFETSVSAYPAITVLAAAEQDSVVVASTTRDFDETSARSLVVWSAGDEGEFAASGVDAHRLTNWFNGNELWPTGSPARLALIEDLNSRFEPLHDPLGTGTSVAIGIATGADKVYVVKDPSIVESDRTLPLSMRRDLMSGVFDWQGNYLINPWGDSGELVDLREYPKLEAYLSSHPALLDRHVAKKAPQSWYRTIDKVNLSILDRPKLLLQDMKAVIHPVLERGGFYPHHNLYYVTSDVWDMEVLGGILLSRVAQAFIEAYCVRMRGGTLRFQAQYLRRIRVPGPGTIDSHVAEELRRAFRARDVVAATAAAALAYGIDLDLYELGGDGAADVA